MNKEPNVREIMRLKYAKHEAHTDPKVAVPELYWMLAQNTCALCTDDPKTAKVNFVKLRNVSHYLLTYEQCP